MSNDELEETTISLGRPPFPPNRTFRRKFFGQEVETRESLELAKQWQLQMHRARQARARLLSSEDTDMSVNAPVPAPRPSAQEEGLTEQERRLCDEITWLMGQVKHRDIDHSFLYVERKCPICRRMKKIKALLEERPYIPQADRQ